MTPSNRLFRSADRRGAPLAPRLRVALLAGLLVALTASSAWAHPPGGIVPRGRYYSAPRMPYRVYRGPPVRPWRAPVYRAPYAYRGPRVVRVMPRPWGPVVVAPRVVVPGPVVMGPRVIVRPSYEVVEPEEVQVPGEAPCPGGACPYSDDAPEVEAGTPYSPPSPSSPGEDEEAPWGDEGDEEEPDPTYDTYDPPARAPAPTPRAAPEVREAPEVAPHGDPLAEIEAAIVSLTNRERAAQGLPPLRVDPRLQRAAAGHSQEMAQLGYFSHTSPTAGRKSSVDRLRVEGVTVFERAAENIAMGTFDPGEEATAFVRMWMDSPGHRQNILDREVRLIGVGAAVDDKGQLIATQVFTRVAEGPGADEATDAPEPPLDGAEI